MANDFEAVMRFFQKEEPTWEDLFLGLSADDTWTMAWGVWGSVVVARRNGESRVLRRPTMPHVKNPMDAGTVYYADALAAIALSELSEGFGPALVPA